MKKFRPVIGKGSPKANKVSIRPKASNADPVLFTEGLLHMVIFVQGLGETVVLS